MEREHNIEEMARMAAYTDEFGIDAAFDERSDGGSSRELGPSDGDDNWEGERKSIVQRLHLPEIAIALIVAGLLASVPFAAHAAEESVASDGSASASAASASAASAGASSASSAASKKAAAGLSVTKEELVSGKKVRTSADEASGVAVTGKGVAVAGDLTVTTEGVRAPAVSVNAGSAASIVSSKLSTSGVESPVLHCEGSLELEDIEAEAKVSPIAGIVQGSSVLVSNSTLTSGWSGAEADKSITGSIAQAVTSGSDVSGAIVFFGLGQEDEKAGETASPDSKNGKSKVSSSAASPASKAASSASAVSQTPTLFQVMGSTIASSIEEGSLFHFTNTKARVVFSNVELEYDAEKANLATVAGNSIDGWGTPGRNGAEVTFSSYDSLLYGDVSADSMSKLGLYLLGDSAWKGAASIVSGGSGASADTGTNILDVNIDATSSWTLTANSTVANLNLETGGMLVDEAGDAVKIVDADGNTLVDGASDIEVKVLGSFTTGISTTSDNELENSSIGRELYDEKFSTSTEFGSNGKPTTPTLQDEARELAARITEWFKNLGAAGE